MSEDRSAEEEQWLRVARAGGPKAAGAFGRLVDLHQARVVRLVTHLLGRAADAEDVAQEAFVRAFLALPRHPPDAPFWPWIRTIATRLAYNHRRDSGTRQRYEDRVPVRQRAAIRSLSDREVLELALDELSYPYREILILRHVEELSVKEIAEQLGLGLSAAKMRLSRARAEFKAIHDRLTK